MLRVVVISILVFACRINVPAQSKLPMTAYFVERMPGNIRADDSGREVELKPDTIYTIYFEAPANPSETWTSAWLDGKKFSLAAVLMDAAPVEVGQKKSTGNLISLKPSGKNRIWQLQFSRTGFTRAPVRAKKGEIILQGKSGKKTITQRITRVIELEPLPSV